MYIRRSLHTSVGAGDDPRKVIVQKLSLVVEGREDVELDLTGDPTKFKDTKFVIKEGCDYRLKITFKVQNEIVSGLKYIQAVYRKGIRVDKAEYMIGSYGPKQDSQTFLGPLESAPSGMMARGSYTVKSRFCDDDKQSHLDWTWAFDIKKDYS